MMRFVCAAVGAVCIGMDGEAVVIFVCIPDGKVLKTQCLHFLLSLSGFSPKVRHFASARCSQFPRVPCDYHRLANQCGAIKQKSPHLCGLWSIFCL
jgi:hypothetical protein